MDCSSGEKNSEATAPQNQNDPIIAHASNWNSSLLVPHLPVSSVIATFHQGNEKFGETRGTQCSCISLFAIVFSAFKNVAYFNSNDLEYILEQGDALYKTIGSHDFLSCPDLPREFMVENVPVTVEFINNASFFGFLHSGSNCLSELITNLSANFRNSGILFFCEGYCFSIIKSARVYVIDSHARNQLGEPSADGTAVILKFNDIVSVAALIKYLYMELPGKNMVLYEVQYIRVSSIVSQALRTAVQRSHKSDRQKNANRNNVLCRVRKHRVKRNNASIELNFSKKIKSDSDFSQCIKNFKSKILNGPLHVCVICNRSLYSKSTKKFIESSYSEFIQSINTKVYSFDGQFYICLTCSKKCLKNQMPCQAVHNKLFLDPVPNALESLNCLETALISKRLLFKKIMIMPKGQFPKIKGAICNIPISLNDSCNILPRNSTNSGILFVKLKKRLQFKGHVYFQPVCRSKLNDALLFLKVNNKLYADIEIDLNQIPPELLNLLGDEDHDIEVVVDSNIETTPNYLDQFRHPAVESFTLPLDSHEQLIEIAPGENKMPHCVLTDEFCEELSFPKLFPAGRFGYKFKRDIPLSPVKYFNQRLLNYEQRFASVADYIFFAQFVLQLLNLSSQINVALKKVTGRLTAGMFGTNYKETLKSFVAADQGYTFMNHIKGTPAFWKRFQGEVFAMIRQLGCPTFFLTLSCADLHWEELVFLVSALDNRHLTKNDIDAMTYLQRCEILNKNPVLLARHFQYRVELLFAEIILLPGGPFVSVPYYAIRVEFQFRGSPHIHCFLWILNAPKLSKSNIEEYINFVDSVIQTYIPSESEDPELHHLVQKFQLHQHSRSCRKYKNIDCRYGFGHYFTDKTIIAQPLPEIMPSNEKSEILSRRSTCLAKVKKYIDTYLHPKSSNYVSDITIEQILAILEISSTDYYEALAISSSDDFEIHLKRPPNSCFINSYNPTILKAWEANMDLQVVHNYYKAVSYMCAYFSKSETESSEAMKLAAQEIRNMKMKQKEAMFKIASAFTNSRQLSIQEAVYHCLPELWLRKCFPRVLFMNTNLPADRFRICKSENELQELDLDSTDVFKSSLVDKYMDRPTLRFQKGKYASVDNICFALFAAYYRIDYQDTDITDSQPRILTEELSEQAHDLEFQLPKNLPLMSSSSKMIRRKVRQVLRFHTPNSKLYPEKYAHHLLFLYFPFRSENELIFNNSYCQKLSIPQVSKIVDENRAIFEPNANEIELAFNNIVSSIHADTNHDKAQIYTLDEDIVSVDSDILFGIPHSNSSTVLLPNDSLCEIIRSLNKLQRQVFDAAFSWARYKVKTKLAGISQNLEPIRLFITGGAGCGKSHLIHAIYHAWTNLFSISSSDVSKVKVLLIAPTGVAAININGTTVNSALGIPPNNKMDLPSLSSEKKCTLRNMYLELQAVIIDEISMISNVRLMQIHRRLCEIFGCEPDVKFANLSLIVVGDLLQLPPIRQQSVFSPFKNEFLNICHPWFWFKCCELTECMRQQGDIEFISLLNSVREGKLSSHHISLLQTRSALTNEVPEDAIYIFATNAQKDVKNHEKLLAVTQPEITLCSTDKIPPNISESQVQKALNCSVSEAGGLSKVLILKKYARVMITTNIDIQDRLINGQMGTVFDFYPNNNSVTTIFVKLDDQTAGLTRMRKSNYGMQHNVVPIYQTESHISLGKNSCSITRLQFPLVLAYACTVHKVQGLTLSKAVFSFDLGKQKSFNNGQVYVALSRVRKIDDLYILGDICASAIRADQDTLSEYQRLRSEANFFQIEEINEPVLYKISLLNTRSLRKHVADIAMHSKLCASHLVCLTETQLSPSDSTDTISQHFQNHSIVFSNNVDKFCSLALLVNSDVFSKGIFATNGVSVNEITVVSLNLTFRIMLVYKKHGQPLHSLKELMVYVMRVWAPDVILGDFNINLLASENQHFVEFMTNNNYTQIVCEPTHINGSLLDHVYIAPTMNSRLRVNNVEPIYFSDHDAVMLELF